MNRIGLIIGIALLVAGVTFASKAKKAEPRGTATISKPQTVVMRANSSTNTAITRTGELINWQVISGGGGIATSAGYNINMAIAQPAIGDASSSNYSLSTGFMGGVGGVGGGTCCINRGNVDDIIGPGGPVDVSDLTYIVAFLFKGGPEPPCIEQGNVDGIVGPGGPIDVSDLTYIVAFLFKGGPVPPGC